MRIRPQLDSLDCGLSVIQALHRHFYRRWLDLNYLRAQATFGPRGLTGHNLVKLAQKVGLVLTGYRLSLAQLKAVGRSQKWWIALIGSPDQPHYVVLGWQKGRLVSHDPRRGKLTYTLDHFAKVYLGIVFSVEKLPVHWKSPRALNLTKLIGSSVRAWVLVFALGALEMIVSLLGSFLVKLAVDLVIPSQLTRLLIALGALFAWLALLGVFFQTLETSLTRQMILDAEYRLCHLYWQSFFSRDQKALDQLSVSEHLRRVGLLGQICPALVDWWRDFFGAIGLIFLTVSLLSLTGWQILTSALLIASLSSFLSIFAGQTTRPFLTALIAKQSDYLAELVGAVLSKDQLKFPPYQHYVHRRIASGLERVQKAQRNGWSYQRVFWLWHELIRRLGQIGITLVALFLALKNQISLGQALFGLAIAHNLLDPIQRLVSAIQSRATFQVQRQMVETIFKLPAEKNPAAPLALTSINQIVCDNLTFRYERPLWKINHFELRSNLHLVGKNGVGKSTWLRVLAGQCQGDRPILVNGTELDNYRLADYRQKVYLVNSSKALPSASLWEVLTCASRAASLRLSQNRAAYQLDQILTEFGLTWNQRISDFGQNLSTGQRQLLALLPLFAWSFDLILLDEALENIDRKWTKWLSDRLKQVQNARWVEVSRSQNYLMPGSEVEFEKIATGR